MLIESKIYQVGNGKAVHLPKQIERELNIDKGDKVKIDIVENKNKGDKKNALLIVLED